MSRRALPLLCCLAVLACGRAPSGRAHASDSQGDALTVCARPTTVPGIDVSDYDDTVDWRAAADGGVVFAIARISDGTGYVDTQFQANWAGILDAGMVRGAYQFFEAGENVTQEAALVVQSVGELRPDDLPVALDIEAEPSGAVPTVAQMQSWMELVEQGTGKKPMIYAGKSYWDSHYGAQFAATPLWVANWQVLCPSLPAAWSNWAFWQDSATGSVPGLDDPGAVDLDVFNGSRADLLAFAEGSASSCAPEQGACAADGDCCVGLSCLGGACATAPSCAVMHAACTAPSDCCDGLTCLTWTPTGGSAGTYCCFGVGASCTSDRECCGGDLCTGGTCACVPEGRYCQNDVDCCAGLRCQAGACEAATSSGSSSGTSSAASTSGGSSGASASSGASTTGGGGGGTSTATASSGAASGSGTGASGGATGSGGSDEPGPDGTSTSEPPPVSGCGCEASSPGGTFMFLFAFAFAFRAGRRRDEKWPPRPPARRRGSSAPRID